MVSFQTEGPFRIGVYRTNCKIGLIYRNTNKIWCFALDTCSHGKPIPTLSIVEMRNITGMMGIIDGTDMYGASTSPYE